MIYQISIFLKLDDISSTYSSICIVFASGCLGHCHSTDAEDHIDISGMRVSCQFTILFVIFSSFTAFKYIYCYLISYNFKILAHIFLIPCPECKCLCNNLALIVLRFNNHFIIVIDRCCVVVSIYTEIFTPQPGRLYDCHILNQLSIVVQQQHRRTLLRRIKLLYY